MHKFLAPVMKSFIAFRKASDRWNDGDAQNLRYFDRHCAAMFPGAMELTQEMVDGWCRRRDTELSNTCRGRIYVVHHFVCYLKERGLTGINEPPIPTKAPRTYIPHAFTEGELKNFFKACDSLPVIPRRRDVLSRKIIVPALGGILNKLSGKNFNDTIPDLNWDKGDIYDTDTEGYKHEKV